MKHRIVTAALSLVGFLISLYLWLWKLGLMGPMLCGTGGCETVQLSAFGTFMGFPVALYGVIGHLALLVVSLVGLQPRWLGSRRPTVLILVLAMVGVGFAGYLTYLEAAVIHAWCRWCVTSALIIVAILLTAVAGLRSGSSVNPGTAD